VTRRDPAMFQDRMLNIGTRNRYYHAEKSVQVYRNLYRTGRNFREHLLPVPLKDMNQLLLLQFEAVEVAMQT
jgi:hypothetical protein